LGTADGRHGSYSPPQVLNWVPAPTEAQNLNDPTLPVGRAKMPKRFPRRQHDVRIYNNKRRRNRNNKKL